MSAKPCRHHKLFAEYYEVISLIHRVSAPDVLNAGTQPGGQVVG